MPVNVQEYLELIKSYLGNVKAIAGVVLVIYAIYVGVTEVPGKWGKYFETVAANGQLVERKNNLKEEEKKLNTLSEALDKLETKIALVEEGNSPELAIINVAQSVVELSEKTGNSYVELRPGATTQLDIESMVTLPVNISAGTEGGAAGGAPPGAAASPPAQSAAPASGAGGDPSKGLQAFQYTLIIRGTYYNLALFVQELSKFPDYILINNIKLSPPGGAGGGGAAAPVNIDDIELALEFAIPWAFGKNVPKHGPVELTVDTQKTEEEEGTPEGDGENAPEGTPTPAPTGATSPEGTTTPANPDAAKPTQAPKPAVTKPAAKPTEAPKPAVTKPAAKPTTAPKPAVTKPAAKPTKAPKPAGGSAPAKSLF